MTLVCSSVQFIGASREKFVARIPEKNHHYLFYYSLIAFEKSGECVNDQRCLLDFNLDCKLKFDIILDEWIGNLFQWRSIIYRNLMTHEWKKEGNKLKRKKKE